MDVGDKVIIRGKPEGNWEVLARTTDGRPIVGTTIAGIPHGNVHIIEEHKLVLKEEES